jgi:hypothetical protein
MSGEDIPYQLRPNKFIDRLLFVDLLSRLVIPRGPEKYIYVSMGGRHLVDHYAVYKELGISAQFAFDQNANAVSRQKFNRPTDATICQEMNSADLPSNIDAIFSRFPSKRNLIVWLDFTGATWKAQLQQAIETLVRLQHGDIFRITLNADNRHLSDAKWSQSGAAGPEEFRASRLREVLGDLLPTDVEKIAKDALPNVLSRCIELATEKAKERVSNLSFVPVLLTSYADGQRMLTLTCIVRKLELDEHFPSTAFKKWKYACKGWSDVRRITAPILSSKERHKLDANITKGPKKMLSALKFLPSEDVAQSLAAIESYRTFHRYYPAFRHVDD